MVFIKNKKIKYGVKIAVSLILLLYLSFKIEFEEFKNILANARIEFLLFALFLVIVSVFLRTFRWKIILKAQNINEPYFKLLGIYFEGMFFDNFLPGRFGGDAVRMYRISQDSDKKIGRVTTVIIERGSGLFALLLIGVIMVGINFNQFETVIIPILVFIIFLAFLCGIFILINRNLIKKFKFIYSRIFRLGKKIGLREKVETAYEVLQGYNKEKKPFGFALIISIILWFFIFTSQFVISRALNLDISLRYLFMIVPVVIILTIIPLSLNGLGIREGSYVFFLAKENITTSEAVTFSLTNYFLILFASLIGGFIHFFKQLKKKRLDKNNIF